MTPTPTPERFLADAKQLRLTEREKAEGRFALIARMALQDAAAIVLSADEKAMGRDALLASMRLQSEKQETAAQWWNALITFPLIRMPALALSALIVALGSGALVYAAEFAIPGDPLYALKVDVLEPLREKMIRTPEKHVAWQIRKIERRLGEARKLAATGRLSTAHRENIERRISEQVVTLSDMLVPQPSIETHVAAQEVLAVTLEHYEQSLALDIAPVVFGENQDPPWQPEADHLLKFVQERRAAARSEIEYTITTAIGDTDSSSASAEGSAKMGLSVTGTGTAKKEHSKDSTQSSFHDDQKQDADDDDDRIRIHLPLLRPRDQRSSASAQSVSLATSSSSADGSQAVSAAANAEMEIDVQTDSSASVGASPEEERDLLKKVQEKKKLIERQLKGL